MASAEIMADNKINEMKTNLEKEKEEFRQELKKKYDEKRVEKHFNPKDWGQVGRICEAKIVFKK